jgi:glycosyltransferase involved in cell wall biosynthesis
MVLVGDQDTPYSRALKEFIAWRGIGDRILVEAVAERPYRWYRASDVLVSAADLESMPRSMLEAMSFGLPIADTNVFGVGELLRDGDTGLLGGAGYLSGVDALLSRVAKMPSNELREMGERGRAVVHSQYDSTSYAEVYRGLLGL